MKVWHRGIAYSSMRKYGLGARMDYMSLDFEGYFLTALKLTL